MNLHEEAAKKMRQEIVRLQKENAEFTSGERKKLPRLQGFLCGSESSIDRDRRWVDFLIEFQKDHEFRKAMLKRSKRSLERFKRSLERLKRSLERLKRSLERLKRSLDGT